MGKIDNFIIGEIPYEIVPEIAPLFSTDTAYYKGDCVIYNAVLYKFTANHAAGTWTGNDVETFKVADKLNEISDSIAPEFDETTSYSAGRYVYKNGVLYRFTAAHSGAWTGSDAEVVTVGGEVEGVSDGFNKLKKAIVTEENIEIDVTKGEYYSVFISTTTGKWSSGSGRRSYFVAKPQKASKITITANTDNITVFAMLKDNTNSTGNYPNYAAGTGRIVVGAGSTEEFNIPDDCNYLYFLGYVNDVVYTPSSVIVDIEGYTDETLTLSGKSADSKVVGDMLDCQYVETEFYTNESWAPGYLGSTSLSPGATSKNDYYTPIPIKVYKGEKIHLDLAFSLLSASEYAYVYYAFCDKNGRYNTRYGFSSNSKYTRTDSTYHYFEGDIDVPDDGYFIMSFRNRLSGHEYENVSSVIGSYYSTGILRNREGLGNVQEAAETGYYFANVNLFPAECDLPIDIVHRGLATSDYPENTMPAFKDAIEKGWKYIETDIRKTQDGTWVLLHDDSINRTARNADGTTISGTVNIADITYSQALDYDFGIYAGDSFAGTHIPTLDAFLNLCNKAHVYPVLEVKDSSISQTDADAVWEIVKKYQMQNRIIWLCSSFGGVKRFLAKNPYAPCIQTSSTDWGGVDISTLTPNSAKPYACDYQTGKNKVFHERLASAFTSKELMDNFVDYLHYFGVYAGVYCPTTTAGINACSDRLDVCTTQYLKYSDVKAESVE